jgi:hypothetical protein
VKIAAIATDDLRRVRLRLLEKSQRGRTDDKPLALLSLVTHRNSFRLPPPSRCPTASSTRENSSSSWLKKSHCAGIAQDL